MGAVRNILFIMSDQLRRDHLSCYGHPTLETPHLDSLARRGVKFTRAYTPAPVCGPARMSFYSGRSMFSLGSVWNFVPLSFREAMLGDLVRPHGVDCALIGKTHYGADAEGMQRFGIDPASEVGKYLVEAGFEATPRFEGQLPDPDDPYQIYLRAHGYPGDDPWNEYVQSAVAPDGRIVSGWYNQWVNLPARVAEEHSETAWTTDCAIDFIRKRTEKPWLLHLSYIKPHWPYLAPAPYHDMYGPADCLPVNRSDAELADANPVFRAYTEMEDCRMFQRDDALARVRPAYMGLVKQLDDHIGRLLAVLEETGRMDDTLIVFTADHGDYLGDHFLDEKDNFHEVSAGIPLIVYDPDDAASGTRGSEDSRLIEGIDLAPTFLDALGLDVPEHILEGRSIVPLLRGAAVDWRETAVSEIDYAYKHVRAFLGQKVERCHGWMITGERWKYVLWEDYPPQLFDLEDDPNELRDLGRAAGHEAVRAEMHERLFAWLRARKMAVTLPYDRIAIARDTLEANRGILIGYW